VRSWRGSTRIRSSLAWTRRFITQDEESSGIIDASGFLGPRTFLFDAQVHKAHPETDKVEMGQLLSLRVDDWSEVFDE
jgi:hypothetical protein